MQSMNNPTMRFIQCVVDAKRMIYLYWSELDYSSTELIGGVSSFTIEMLENRVAVEVVLEFKKQNN
jgi:hypothetical protein